MNLFEMFEQGPPEPTLIDALRDFLPLAIKHLKLDHIPKIRLVKAIDGGDQPAFGRYSVDDQAIEVVVNRRNPADILRTLAHEMVHYAQGQRDELDADSGETGSPIEDQANAEAGVIMRVFAQQYPRYLTLPAIEVSGKIDEKRKRKKKSRSVGGGGYYGYYWGGSDSDSGGGGGGESITRESDVAEEWSNKYKKSINCSNPKGFSQKAHCAGRKKNEDISEVAKIKLGTDLEDMGSWVTDKGQSEPTVMLPVSKLTNFEPDDKFEKPENAKNLDNMVKVLKAGKELPPILARRQGLGYQVLDGHHRFMAYKLLGKKYIPARIVAKFNITQTENFADGKNPERKGLAKRSGVNTKASVSDLRKTAKNSTGEKQRMAHWLANMKSGKK